MPRLSLTYVIDEEAYTLVVCRVEPEHAGKHCIGFFDAAEPPEAETVAIQAPEERAVIDVPPGKKPFEVFSEGELADPHANLVVTDGFLRFDDRRQDCRGARAHRDSGDPR